MHGVAIVDEQLRFAWLSWEHPELAGQVVGKPLWHFVPDEQQTIVQAALCLTLHDGGPTKYTVVGGPPNDLRKYDCEIRKLESPVFLVQYRERVPIRLTDRERDVLLALCNDEPPKVTAKRLGISIKTVESFRGILRRKTGARGNSGLVRWAIRAGMVEAY